MTIELTTPAVEALSDYLERCGCTVRFAFDHVLEVGFPHVRKAVARR
jgi:hypothetical protein